MTSSSANGQNWVYLDIPRALEQVGNERALQGMMPMLQEMLDRDLPQIAQFLAHGDVRSANPLLHSLKGCLPIFCTLALCEHLARVEVLSKTGGSPEVGAAYAELSPKLLGLQQEVTRYLNPRT